MINRSLRSFEIDVLIQEIYTQKQKKYILRILKILGDYLVLDSEMLYENYRKRYHEDLKLQHLKRAVKDFLIIEYKHNIGHETEQDIYFYTLKCGVSEYILQQINYGFVTLKYAWASTEKSYILTFNKYLLKNSIKGKTHPELIKLIEKGIFVSKDLKKCYFLSKIIKKSKVKEVLTEYSKNDKTKENETEEEIKEDTSLAEILEMVEITEELYDFGEYTKATDPRHV